MQLNLGQIADWIHAEGDFASSTEIFGYSIDSRTVAAGDLFFAVTGEHLDGHDYVQSALDMGAAAAVVSTRWVVPAAVDPSRLLRVPDSEDCVLRAMQKLAREVRRAWASMGPANGPARRVLGITGSAGKTTTKECVATVLATRFRVLKSAGNLNNGFGLPLQLLKLEPTHDIAVLEMGMNHSGELAALAHIAEPDWAVVSNVAPVHLEHFPAGIEGIAAAKYELVQSIPPQGIAFLNADDLHVRHFGRDRDPRNIRTFGLHAETATVRATAVESMGAEGMRFLVHTATETAPAQIALLGEHNVYNALAAIAVGLQAGVPLHAAIETLSSLQPSDKRGELLHFHGAQLLNDTYNSNPRALDSMVDALTAVDATRRIVVAGEMLELGPDSAALHRCSGKHMRARKIDLVLGVRGHASSIVEGFNAGITAESENAAPTQPEAIFLETPEAAGAWLRDNLREGDAVLLKASRGVRLERALTALQP